MARSDDDTVEVGCNDERRMCGLAGDDDEEDLREDGAELFGINPEEPIDVGDDNQGGEGNQDANAEDDEHGSRPSTSAVWQDFQKLFKKVPGKRKPVRYAAKCLHCSKQYSALSKIGTGHLIRHRDSCPRRREKTSMSQSQISFNRDGSMRNWEYCPMRARNELVRFLARLDVPISMGESDAFEEYIRTAHNPAFVPVSRQTTTRDMVKYFTDKKAKLVETLSSSAVNCVCLTSDIWSGNAK